MLILVPNIDLRCFGELRTFWHTISSFENCAGVQKMTNYRYDLREDITQLVFVYPPICSFCYLYHLNALVHNRAGAPSSFFPHFPHHHHASYSLLPVHHLSQQEHMHLQ